MIKIGMFVDSYFPMVDGVTHVIHNYSKRLQGEEFDVTVFCPQMEDKKVVDDYPYHVVRCKSVKVFFLDYSWPWPEMDLKFKKILENSNLDIVHVHSPFGVGAIGVKYAKERGIPAIAFLHTQYEQDFYRATKNKVITKWLLGGAMKVFNGCDEFYAVNEKVADIYLKYGASHRPLVQKNCTDFVPVDETAAHALVNQRYGLRDNETVFLFVGRINALKNIFLIAEALSYLRDKNFKMLFVGEGQDMEQLKKKVDKLGLENNVIFTGRIKDRDLLQAIYCRAKLFLFPSLYDASSLVQIEAASQKTPTLFVEGSATGSSATDNVNGFFAKADPQLFAQRIEEILSDEELYRKVSEGAFRDLYRTWDDAVREMKEIYINTIQNYKIPPEIEEKNKKAERIKLVKAVKNEEKEIKEAIKTAEKAKREKEKADKLKEREEKNKLKQSEKNKK